MLQRQVSAMLAVMTQISLLTILCAFPKIVAAQDELPRIDWDVVFAENAERVVTTLKDGRQQSLLELPNAITVWKVETADGANVTAMDQSKIGAVGCGFSVYFELSIVAGICPNTFNTEQTQRLADLMDKLTIFVGANSVPPITGGDLEKTFARFKERALSKVREDQNVCETLDQGNLGAFLTAEADVFIDEMLSVPRLPVNNPCL